MSDVTGTARWLRVPVEMDARQNIRLACLIVLTALLVLRNLANDAALDAKYGWDIRLNCAAVDAHAEGLDPYFVMNLKGTKLSYPYLPVTLDVFCPLCAGGLSVGLLLPALISITGHTFEGGFGLLIVALTLFWILLLEPMRLEPEGVHPWRTRPRPQTPEQHGPLPLIRRGESGCTD